MRVTLKLRPWRTLSLAILSTVVLVWAAITRFGVAPQEMLALLVACLIGLVLIIGAAFAGFMLRLLLSRAWRRGGRN